MRTKPVGNGIRARAIAGIHTVLIALDVAPGKQDGLLGFAIRREGAGEKYWLKGVKVFPSVVPNPPQGAQYSTLDHPVQSLIWGDYTAKPGTRYKYVIRPVYGVPKNLEYGDDLGLEVETERELDPETMHGVWFNRGAVASQAYAAKYRNEPPPEPENPEHEQTRWLSRGLLEACLKFIDDTKASQALRVAAYEFTYAPILQALKRAAGRGVDVQVVYEAGKVKKEGVMVETDATKGNKKAITAAKFKKGNPVLIRRTRRSAIPHNKFIVRVDGNGDAVAVWTGSTNFTESGFLGQTNVGHLVQGKACAAKFLEYWTLLAEDPEPEDLEEKLDALTPQPGDELEAGTTTCLFSPRKTSKMLDWYAKRVSDATGAILYTGGFGVTDKLAVALSKEKDFLRYLLLEKPPTAKARKLLGSDRGIVTVYGNVLGEVWTRNKKGELTIRKEIPGFNLEKWFIKEEHFRKRKGHVFFVHTKILIVDPLSSDPLVFSGSANFSPASLTANDENMLLIRGEPRVADIYLTEIDRMLRHFQFRNIAARQQDENDGREAIFLDEDATWLAPYFKSGNFKDRRRRMFFP